MHPTLNTALAKRMADASAIQSASIIGQPGGWSVLLKVGMVQQPLGAQRSDKPRTWRSLDRCVDYLKKELHIARFDLLDATEHSPAALLPGKAREDAAARLRGVHAAAAHDKWFRAQVELAVVEADDPGAEWVSQVDADADWLQKRTKLLAQTEQSSGSAA